MNIEKYIHIPFKSHGRDFEGCDCYGLVRLFLENEFGIVLPDFWDYMSAEDSKRIMELIEENKPLIAGEPKDIPDIGDIVLYKFQGYVSHVAVYVGEGRILHVMRNSNSCCVPIDHGRLKGRIAGFYGIKQD